MLKKLNKTYRSALLTAAYASIISMLILGVFSLLISGFNLWHIFVFGISFFGICFAARRVFSHRLTHCVKKHVRQYR